MAASPDGARGYVAAGRRVVTIDLNARTVTGGIDLAGAISGLAITPDGGRLLAARRGAIDVLDTATLTVTGTVNLKGSKTGALAVSADATWAAVGLGRRVGLVALTELRLDRRMSVGEVGGIAFPPSGRRILVSTTDGALRGITRSSGRENFKIRLKRGAGAALAISPNGAPRGGRRDTRQPRDGDRRPAPPAPADARAHGREPRRAGLRHRGPAPVRG